MSDLNYGAIVLGPADDNNTIIMKRRGLLPNAITTGPYLPMDLLSIYNHMESFLEWLKNIDQFDDANYASEKLIKAGMSKMANVPEILEAMEIMGIAPWDGTSKEIFAARIKQILRGNVSRSDFSRGVMDGIRLKP